MKRRTLLAVTGAGLAPSVAGCRGDNNPDDGDGGNETADSADETDAGANEDDTNEADEPLLFEDAFSATSQGGFLAIDEAVDTRSEAREEGFVLPDGDEPLALDAEVSADGSWESTDIEFPMLQTEAQGFTIEAELEFVDGLSGTLTEKRMTASGTINVVIEKPTEGEFSFEVVATSEKSGNLSGETNFAEPPLTATLVDNEFVIDDDTGNLIIDGQLGLPAEEPGTNWFEIDIELTEA
jgi:hypothetical protein